MKHLCLIFISFSVSLITNAQNHYPPCSKEKMIERQLQSNPNLLLELELNEEFIKNYIKLLKTEREENKQGGDPEYIIPVVLHVFHTGDEGLIDMEQAQSGIDILNRDFNGLNNDWNTIDPAFDSIKATLDIQFCLASIDPQGNPTTGVNYYDDEQAMLNNVDLFQYAWDNFKYLNIYLPKYTQGAPSLFSGYAYLPNLSGVSNNMDGIFFSSIRWGYGSNSELEEGQEWASVCTHEMGHWLNLYHTFSECDSPGDLVEDTPPTTGGDIELEGCNNNDFSCGVSTNGENYMDYNHDCKKMFTQGQVDRMTAALQLASRNNLWSEANLLATGCSLLSFVKENDKSNVLKVYPNPASDYINFSFENIPSELAVYSIEGKLVFYEMITENHFNLHINDLGAGIYFYSSLNSDRISKGKFIKN